MSDAFEKMWPDIDPTAAPNGRHPDNTAPIDLGEWDAGDDDELIPPRGWLLGNTFCRRFLSSLIADGGVGKTAVRIAQLLALATGTPLTGEHVFQRCRVLIVSLEDDRDELRRRVKAAMLHHGVIPDDVRGWLYLAAPGPHGWKLATAVNGEPTVSSLRSALAQTLGRARIDVVCLDPFIKSHSLHLDNTEAQAREIIKTWVKNGVLKIVDYHDEESRKDREGLRVEPAKRPG